MFKIIVDSTSDLGFDLRDKYDIDYCHMMINVDDKEYSADLDYKLYSVKELYDWMRNGKRVYTTQVANQEFESVFKKYLELGYDILYISCSGALSASIQAANIIKEKLSAEYPDRKIVCFDSLISSFGQGSMAIKASLLQKEGKTLEEVVSWLTENRLRFNQFATVDSLEYLRRAGRVKASKAFFGNLFGVKPIIISDVKGRNYAYEKEKGKKNAITKICNLAIDCIGEDYEQTIYIAHADCLDQAELIKNTLIQLQPKLHNFYIGPIGPIVGASTGPGTLAIYCYGKEVTLDEEGK